MAATVTYTTINGVLYAEDRGGTYTEYIRDPLGSLVGCRDSAGAISYTAEYWPYGEVQTETGTNPSPWGFVGLLGYLKDMASLLYVRARYLQTVLGRWATVDPLWPGESAYGYAGNNPATVVDPSGTQGTATGSIPIPIPAPKGINAEVWARVVAYLVALGIPIVEITAVLLALVALLAITAFSCAVWKKLRYDVCPHPEKPSSGLTSCKDGDFCMGTMIRAEEWGKCAAIQLMLSALCYPPGRSHKDILEKYIRDFLKCSALIAINCDPVRCVRRWIGF